MKNHFEGVSSDFNGEELEEAYSAVIGGRVRGGFGDRGMDIIDVAKDIPAVQVKSTWINAKRFLAESRSRKEFIPILVGDYGQVTQNLKSEILDSIRRYGGWVSHQIPEPQRTEYLNEIADTKKICTPAAPQKIDPRVKAMFGL